jgi:hypothetical protein
MTFRTLAAAAEADKESALHSPIIQRGLLQGYAATQGLAIRRLVDTTKKVISLQKLLDDIKNKLLDDIKLCVRRGPSLRL